MSSTIIRMGNDSFSDNPLMEIFHDGNYEQETALQNANSFRSLSHMRVVHSRPAFSNLNSNRNIAANMNSSHNSSLSSASSSSPSPFLSSSFSSSASSSHDNSTPRTPVRAGVQTESALNMKSPRSRYVQQCRSIAKQLQLTPSSFKKHHLMRSPIVTSKSVAAERKRYQEMLESVFNDSLEHCRNDESSESSLNQSQTIDKESSSDNDSIPSVPVKKVGAFSKVNKARRRFRF